MAASYVDPDPSVGPGPAETALRICGMTLRLRGEFDVVTRAALTKKLAPLSGTQPAWLVIDLAEVSLMDCGSAAALFEVARQVLPPDAKPVIRAPRPIVRRVLEITGWDSHCVLDG